MEGASSSSRISSEQVTPEEQSQPGSSITVDEDAKQVHVPPFTCVQKSMVRLLHPYMHSNSGNDLQFFEHC